MPTRGAITALISLWGAVALLLAAWGAAGTPGSATHAEPGAREVRVLTEAPGGGLLSLWLHWDAAEAGWVVLQAGQAWPLAGELYWRRRVHPGWNHLLWHDLSALRGEPVTLRIAEGDPASWSVTAASVTSGYALGHLGPLRGFLIAAALAAGLTVVVLVRILRAATWPGSAIWGAGLAALAGLALWLRLHTLGSQSFWFDEVLTAIGAQSLTWVLYTPQIFGHPPLQYLAALATAALGADESSLRAPFLAAGVATIVATACLGRRLLGPGTGLLAAGMLALAPFHVELSQLARPYAFLLLFSVLSLLALLRALEEGRGTDWLWFSALAALNVYTHYLALEVLLLEAVTAGLWLRRAGRLRILAALVSFGAVGLLLLPWVPVFRRLGAAHVGGGALPLPALMDLVMGVFVSQFVGPGPEGLLAAGLVLCGLLGLRRRPRVATTMLLWLVLPLAWLWAAQPAHFVAGRHLAFVMPVVFLLLGHGITSLAGAATRVRRWPRSADGALARAVAGSVAAMLLLMWTAPTAAGLHGYYRHRLGTDWRTVAEVLDRLHAPGDEVVATLGAAYPLRYYWRESVPEVDATSLPRHHRALAAGRRLWIVTLEGWDEAPPLAAWLDRHALQVGEVAPSWSLPRVYIHRARADRGR